MKSVIFDMDGTMIMTEELSSLAFYRVLASCSIIPVLKPTGLVQEINTIGNMAKLKKEYGIRRPLWWLQLRYNKYYREIVQQDGQAMPGLHELLADLHQRKVPMAVASGSLDGTIKMTVDSLGLTHFFGHLVSSRNLEHNKPDPAVFLFAAHLLNTEPEHCVVIEDAESGVKAAKAAGMKVIAVPQKFTAKHDFSAADLVANSLHDVNWDVISQF